MSKKKILIINPISLFPKVMASQDRVLKMVQRLSRDHTVDLAFPVRNQLELKESGEKLGGICHKFFPIPALNPGHKKLMRGIYALKRLFFQGFFYYPPNYFYFSRKYYLKKFSEIISGDTYDIVQVEYWYMGKILEKCGYIKTKIIDSHDILFLKQEQELQNLSGPELSLFKKKYLNRYRELEINSLKIADLIIFITRSDRDSLKKYAPVNRNMVIATGQDIDFFKNFKIKTDEKTILFYGSMGGRSNINAFFDLWYKIIPIIKKDIPEVKVVVVGANPPDSIKKIHNGKTVVVTGFVEDVRPYLARANIFILPMDVAAGFRSRVVDVMAMGVPVIGTRKALDSFEMKDGSQGFIRDSKEEIASCAVKLLKNPVLRNRMGEECKKFVTEKYSIEATYGKLSKYFLEK